MGRLTPTRSKHIGATGPAGIYGACMADDRWGSREHLDAYRRDDLGSPADIPDPQHFFIWAYRAVFQLGRWVVRKLPFGSKWVATSGTSLRATELHTSVSGVDGSGPSRCSRPEYGDPASLCQGLERGVGRLWIGDGDLVADVHHHEVPVR